MFVARSGQQFNRHRTDKCYSFDTELLVISDPFEQQSIINSIHMGITDSDTASTTSSHIGIHFTRAKIFGRFFWRNNTQDVKRFVSWPARNITCFTIDSLMASKYVSMLTLWCMKNLKTLNTWWSNASPKIIAWMPIHQLKLNNDKIIA